MAYRGGWRIEADGVYGRMAYRGGWRIEADGGCGRWPTEQYAEAQRWPLADWPGDAGFAQGGWDQRGYPLLVSGRQSMASLFHSFSQRGRGRWVYPLVRVAGEKRRRADACVQSILEGGDGRCVQSTLGGRCWRCVYKPPRERCWRCVYNPPWVGGLLEM